MTALPPTSLDRLRKICGLLGSTHAGERSAAALKATEMLRSLGLSWDQAFVSMPSTSNWQGEAIAMQAQADMYRRLLEHERERVNRLTREVNRLKGMWPKGKPRQSEGAACPP